MKTEDYGKDILDILESDAATRKDDRLASRYAKAIVRKAKDEFDAGKPYTDINAKALVMLSGNDYCLSSLIQKLKRKEQSGEIVLAGGNGLIAVQPTLGHSQRIAGMELSYSGMRKQLAQSVESTETVS